jgi:hypothetical protein
VIVRFVDIGEIDDHHYLNLLFLNAASPQYGRVIAKWLRKDSYTILALKQSPVKKRMCNKKNGNDN